MTEELKCEYKPDLYENIKGNVIDLDLNKSDSEVRADILVENKKKCCIRVWGQIKDCDGNPVQDALVKLLESYCCHGKIEYKGVAHTVTDCLGYYQFEVCLDDAFDRFRIIASKANTGKERVLHDSNGLCEPCEKEKDKDKYFE